MKNATVLSLMFFAKFLVLPSAAAEIQRVDIVDFLVDWQQYAGKEIIVTGGTVSLAGTDISFLQAAGGTVNLLPPYRDKEDLRYILKNCAGVGTPQTCGMEVLGIVGGELIGNNPVLLNLDLPTGP